MFNFKKHLNHYCQPEPNKLVPKKLMPKKLIPNQLSPQTGFTPLEKTDDFKWRIQYRNDDNFKSPAKQNVSDQSSLTGFTLIELLIYIVVIGGVAVTFISYSLSVAQSRNKTYVIQETQANARTAVEIISQRIKAASAVTIPVNGAFGPALTLVMSDPNKNPTVIDLDANNVLQIKEGAEAAIPITSSKVKVTNLVFTNLSGTSTRENIKVDITVAYDNSSGDVEYSYSQSLRAAVSVRN